ncbi:recombination regulator RecX [Corynebacterium segmentosum]|uniref:recombination regulator RecX n=1 Tax=Corynebacterium accolens TaxID=38284 RepID=UPI00019C44C4|nr:recombination regulator RecX [Corynebacterium accolens]EEI13906.1 regulatory protein RecX [Corynebacterium accolens ATCC 49725]UQZ28174.1 Regulatory protein RecX [Corynebacterium accolens]
MNQPAPEKLEQLRQALEAYEKGEAGGGLFDREAEEAKLKVRSRALGLLDQRSRSRQELYDRLVQAEFDPEVVDEVLDDLAHAGLIDDAAFAAEWVRQRHKRRGKSRSVLDRELREKGVSQEDRDEALSQIDAADEEAMARALAEKKARGVKSVPVDRKEREKALRRIVGVLARRGFNEGMSLNIAISALEERCEELSSP